MKLQLSLTVLMVLASSCASVDNIKKKDGCVVWKDQKYLGPYLIDVVDKKVEWKGRCPGKSEKCEPVNVSFDENNNVFRDQANIGKIEKNEFQYAAKDNVMPVITFTSLRVFPETSEIKGSVLVNNAATETVYRYNDKCSPQDAIIGGIALGLIAQIQNKK